MKFLLGRKKRKSSRTVFDHFKKILSINNDVLAKTARMEQALGGGFIFDSAFLSSSVADIAELVHQDIDHLNAMAGDRYFSLFDRFEEILDRLERLIAGRRAGQKRLAVPYSDINMDMDESVGGKNAMLAEIGNMLNIRIPQGFALTTQAYGLFLEANSIPEKIAAFVDLSPQELTRRIADFFILENMPDPLGKAIEEGVRKLGSDRGNIFAVRSSTVGEDGTRSFAGQFASFVHVPVEEVSKRCLEVMASRFAVCVLQSSVADAACREFPVAVGVQTMIDTMAGGVIYTSNPLCLEEDTLLISAVPGSGSRLVSGEVDSDQYFVSRRAPFALKKSILGHGREYTPESLNSRSPQEVDMEQGELLLSRHQLTELAETAMLIEKYFGYPQDIEWAIDKNNVIFILQCRRLYTAEQPSLDLISFRKELADANVILSGCGHPAQIGVASGEVVYVDSRNPPLDFPVGAIAVCRTADPALSVVIRRAAAILTEVGSPTSHLATIAREYRTPALFGCGDLANVLADGQFVTVDVEKKTIYAGYIKSLSMLQCLESEPLADNVEMRMLRRLLRMIRPLHLHDSSECSPEQCRTLHDIIRFCHEKAVEIMSGIQNWDRRSREDRTLLLPLPLKIRLVDLGGGLKPLEKEEIDLADVASLPLQAILQGMLLRGIWENEPVSLGIRDLLSGALATPLTVPGNTSLTGENLAIIAEEYVNLSLQLGYHFNVIDAFISSDPADNYIYFRFIGGMADAARRARRAQLITTILNGLNFKTDLQGDMVTGRINILTVEQAENILGRLGQLIAFTRQLDVRMESDGTIDRLLEKFLAGAITTDQD